MPKTTSMTIDEMKAMKSTVDRAKIAATTEEDIRRYMIEDGEDPDEPFDPSKWTRWHPGDPMPTFKKVKEKVDAAE